MLAFLCLFSGMPIISLILFVFTKWYLSASLLLIVYFLIGIIALFAGNIVCKKLKYRYIILDSDYFEIEDKYGNITRFDKTIIYPLHAGPISCFFNTFSYGMSGNQYFVLPDFSIDNGIEKINCYISFKTYKIMRSLDFKYIYVY